MTRNIALDEPDITRERRSPGRAPGEEAHGMNRYMNPIELTLDINYPHIRKELGEYQFRRYVNVLATRAVRFYIEHGLDAEVVAEDLYKEEDGKYPNLDHSEEQTVRWVESLQGLAGQR
jgi:hypothetical protein